MAAKSTKASVTKMRKQMGRHPYFELRGDTVWELMWRDETGFRWLPLLKLSKRKDVARVELLKRHWRFQ